VFPVLVLIPVLLGCPASTLPEYEKARDEALAKAGPVPANWRPDIVLSLSNPQLDAFTTAIIEAHGALNGKIEKTVLGMTATATPDLHVRKLVLGAASGCTACLAVDVTLDGTVGWAILGQRGSVPVDATAKFDATFEAVDVGDTWSVTMTPKNLRDVSIDLGKVDASVAQALSTEVAQYVREEFLDDVPPIELASFGDPAMPLRAVRFRPVGAAMQLEMLSASPSPGVVNVGDAVPDAGFTLTASQDSLLDLARAASFEHGAVSYDVVVDPTSLQIDGDAFTMGLRLWKTTGRGWWRDYTATGTASAVPRGVKLTAKDVKEGAKSEGAVLSDPLAALGEGVILSSMEDAIATTLPLQHSARAASIKTGIRIDAIRGEGGNLVIVGSLTPEAAKRAPSDASTTPTAPTQRPAGDGAHRPTHPR
jgi:hypothetical protein